MWLQMFQAVNILYFETTMSAQTHKLWKKLKGKIYLHQEWRAFIYKISSMELKSIKFDIIYNMTLQLNSQHTKIPSLYSYCD